MDIFVNGTEGQVSLIIYKYSCSGRIQENRETYIFRNCSEMHTCALDLLGDGLWANPSKAHQLPPTGAESDSLTST